MAETHDFDSLTDFLRKAGITDSMYMPCDGIGIANGSKVVAVKPGLFSTRVFRHLQTGKILGLVPTCEHWTPSAITEFEIIARRVHDAQTLNNYQPVGGEPVVEDGPVFSKPITLTRE